MLTMYELEPRKPLEARHRLAFVVRLPCGLAAAIERQSMAARGMMDGCLPPLSPPHLTLLYMPCGMLGRDSLRRAVMAVRSMGPITLRYSGVHISSYGTVQLEVHPRSSLRLLHSALIAAMGLDGFTFAPVSRLLDMFGTANFGEAYTPHVTLGHFGTATRAEAAAHCFASLPEMEQSLSTVWLADASGCLDHRLSIGLRGTAP